MGGDGMNEVAMMPASVNNEALEKALEEIDIRIEASERFRKKLDSDIERLKTTKLGLENAIRIVTKTES
jgi:hypothetical protein